MNNDELKDDLLFDFHSYMTNNNDIKDESGYYSSGIHCSSLGMCKRKVIMDFYKFPKKEHGLTTLLMFEGGNHFHRMVQAWIRNSNRFKSLAEEFNVTEGLPKPITGKLDTVFQDTITGQIILADVKTAMPNQFKDNLVGYLPKENHIIQVTAYAKGYKELGYHYDQLAIMYFDRAGSNKPLIYFVEPYPDISQLMDEYILAQLRYEQDKILPDRLASKSWECDYCDYMNISCEGYIKDAKDEFAEYVKNENKKGKVKK